MLFAASLNCIFHDEEYHAQLFDTIAALGLTANRQGRITFSRTSQMIIFNSPASTIRAIMPEKRNSPGVNMKKPEIAECDDGTQQHIYCPRPRHAFP